MKNIKDLIGTITAADSVALMDELPDGCVDLVVSDGPYGVTTHEWDAINNIQEYNLTLLHKFSRLLKPGGAVYLFGKQDGIDFVDYRPHLTLQSRIIWYQPSRLAQGRRSYTNNYDTIFYFTKGKPATFNLEDIRVPQLVELEHRKRCENVPSVKNGPYSKTVFNEHGKNPGDVWGDIKQLTYRSKELMSRELLHTIQKPERLIERIVKASSHKGDIVFDPFVGSGTVPVVCDRLERYFVGCEINTEYLDLANQRLRTARQHKLNEERKSLFLVDKPSEQSKLFTQEPFV
ncbi:MAG TPA: site-specific DNA-methyltransferase [Pyrinomonadaceae bacterium]|jgi:DNA modification methylase